MVRDDFGPSLAGGELGRANLTVQIEPTQLRTESLMPNLGSGEIQQTANLGWRQQMGGGFQAAGGGARGEMLAAGHGNLPEGNSNPYADPRCANSCVGN